MRRYGCFFVRAGKPQRREKGRAANRATSARHRRVVCVDLYSLSSWICSAAALSRSISEQKKKLRFARKFRKNNRFVDQQGVNSKPFEVSLLVFRDKLPYHFYLDCSGRHGNEISRRV
jgi:hypothetical protein